MQKNKIEHEEAMALLSFVEERLRELDPEPKFFGKKKWHKRMERFEANFLSILEDDGGPGNFYGAIWRIFECNDALFIGENGMKDLADHTKYKDGTWTYSKPNGGGPRVIYTAA